MEVPNVPTSARTSWLDKCLLTISGVDEQTLRQCPPHDWEAVRAVAAIMIFTWLYQAALFSIIAHKLFAQVGRIRPELILASMFLATFIMLIDSYMVMRSGWHLSGIEELKRGGIDVSGGIGARIKAGVFLAIRIFLSVGIAQLTAIFLSLLIFESDIASRVRDAYLHNNADLIAVAAKQVDAEISRGKDTLNAEGAREAALASQVNALRQNQIDPSANQPEMHEAQQEVDRLSSEKEKADDAVESAETFASNELGGIRGTQGNTGIPGEGPVRRAAIEAVANAKNHAQQITAALDAARSHADALRRQSISSNEASKQQSHDTLPGFENKLKAEDDKVRSLRGDLVRLTTHRDNAIRDAVNAALDHRPLNNGLVAQIAALEQIAQADSKIAAVIILIDLTSFGFELAAVLAKVTSFVPTTYAALLARDAYMRVVRLVDEMMVELNRDIDEADTEVDLHPPFMPSDETPGAMNVPLDADPFAHIDPTPSRGQRRPRGRPKKTQSDANGRSLPVPYKD